MRFLLARVLLKSRKFSTDKIRVWLGGSFCGDCDYICVDDLIVSEEWKRVHLCFVCKQHARRFFFPILLCKTIYFFWISLVWYIHWSSIYFVKNGQMLRQIFYYYIVSVPHLSLCYEGINIFSKCLGKFECIELLKEHKCVGVSIFNWWNIYHR